MARSIFVFAMFAVAAVFCLLALRQSTQVGRSLAPTSVRPAAISRSVRVYGGGLKYPQSGMGSWGDAIRNNAQGEGKPKIVRNKKTWWNCMDPKWRNGGAASSESASEAQQWINTWKTATGK
eukprot:CAMPEP_0167753240 /NCGR_PEP_ID=MMETSP0110_2-20121227/7598_1 /TAXON_ID=629695 /ORGANISM="Gymnochlora sp., Strain CCMP2014" /LENGTH=121 /DNA_ID=CAMNT_0007638973 /DNA_START=61 /DNA_END=426 /DNA_ORIENTATION=-